MISKLIAWVTDPKMIARKRTIVTFLSTFAAGLIAAKGLIAFMCAQVESGVAQFLCSVNIDQVAIFISAFVDLVNRPEIGAVGFISGLWALISGFRKDKAKIAARMENEKK